MSERVQRLKCGNCGGDTYGIDGCRHGSIDAWSLLRLTCTSCGSTTEVEPISALSMEHARGPDGRPCRMGGELAEIEYRK